MRGKVNEELELDANYRITPAYAGKSSVLKDSSSMNMDHPRLCGEKDIWH